MIFPTAADKNAPTRRRHKNQSRVVHLKKNEKLETNNYIFSTYFANGFINRMEMFYMSGWAMGEYAEVAGENRRRHVN